jgi:hypothetical protein
MPKRLHSLLAAVLILILAGCSTKVPPETKRPNSDAAERPAIAIEVDGTRHTVWMDCPTNPVFGCKLVYERTTLAGQSTRIELAPGSHVGYSQPDVAVTSTGDAHIIWNSVNYDTSSFATISAIIPKNSTTTPAISIGLGGPSPAEPSAPALVARGTVVYALYYVGEATAIRLYARQLAPTLGLAKVMAGGGPDPRGISSDGVGVIDSNNVLTIAYKYTAPIVQGRYQALFLSTPGGYNSLVANDGGYREIYSAPDLVVDAAGAMFLSYVKRGPNGVSDTIHVDKISSATLFTVPLPASAGVWKVRSTPRLTATSTGYAVTFAAYTSANDATQIWIYNAGDAAPKQLSATVSGGPVVPTQPLIGALDGKPVVVWREENTLSEPGCQKHGYLWSAATGIRQVHLSAQASCPTYTPSFDFATSGGWGAGIAIDGGAWVSFNAP